MEERNKLIELVLEDLKFDGGDCLLCVKMEWKCPVVIPESPPSDFQPDLSVCNFRQRFYKTLTTEH